MFKIFSFHLEPQIHSEHLGGVVGGGGGGALRIDCLILNQYID